MENKYWLMIGLVVLLLGCVFVLNISKDEIYFEHNGVSISEKEYKAIQKQFPNQTIRICNLENKKCIGMIPIN